MSECVEIIKNHWESFWFKPVPPLALGLCRILFYGMLLGWFLEADFTACAEFGRFFWVPISFFRLLSPNGPPPVEWLAWMQVIWKVSLIAAFFGFATRLATGVACVLGIYLIGLAYNLGKTNHAMAAVALALLVMAVSDCGRSCSLDQLFGRRFGNRRSQGPSAEYFWPIQLMRVIICLVLFTAGSNKLRESGLAWVSSETVQMNILEKGTPFGHWLAQWSWLCHLIAAFTILVEFLQPLALVSKRFAIFFIPAGVSMFIGIELTMGISFLPLILLYLFWLPWGFLYGERMMPPGDAVAGVTTAAGSRGHRGLFTH